MTGDGTQAGGAMRQFFDVLIVVAAIVAMIFLFATSRGWQTTGF
jgi:hypothetical protein